MYWIILSSLIVLSVAEECSYNHLTNTTLYPKSSIKNGAQLLVSSHLDEDLCYQGCCEDTRCDVSLYYAKKNKNTHSCFYFKCNDKCIFKPSSSDVYSSVRVSRSQPQDAFLDLPSVSTNPPTKQDNSNKTDDAKSENVGTSDRLVHVTNTTHEASDDILSTLNNITSTIHDKNTEVSDGVKSGGSDSEEDIKNDDTDDEEENSVNNESEESEDSDDDTDTDANNTEDSVKGDKSSGDKPKEEADTNDNNITHNNLTDSTNKTKDGNHGKGTVVITDSNSNKTDNSTSVVHSKDGGKHNSTDIELKVEIKTEIEGKVEEGAYSTRDIVFWSAVIVGSALILFGLVSLIKVYRSKRRSFYSSLTDDYLINGMYSI